MVYAVATRLDASGELGPQGMAHLIDACQALGKGTEALDLARQVQRREPGSAVHAARLAALQDWLDWRQAFPPLDATGDLALEPLAHHHERDFAWQYLDPAIATLCCLPVFIDALDWHHWLAATWRGGGRLPFAVFHRDWGFIGCVSLTVHGDTGFLYYWIGRDFQGRGFGPRAGKLVLDLGERAYGVRACYAKAFDTNLRSRRGLETMGFCDLGMRGAGDDANQVFYRRGPAQARRRTVDQLDWLLDRMDAGVRPAPSPPRLRERHVA